ncbi:alpha mannosidase-like protein [Geranomyces michiganensis]|nr:alpha mannosidase-like protein [Geranomyces michiganensis]
MERTDAAGLQRLNEKVDAACAALEAVKAIARKLPDIKLQLDAVEKLHQQITCRKELVQDVAAWFLAANDIVFYPAFDHSNIHWQKLGKGPQGYTKQAFQRTANGELRTKAQRYMVNVGRDLFKNCEAFSIKAACCSCGRLKQVGKNKFYKCYHCETCQDRNGNAGIGAEQQAFARSLEWLDLDPAYKKRGAAAGGGGGVGYGAVQKVRRKRVEPSGPSDRVICWKLQPDPQRSPAVAGLQDKVKEQFNHGYDNYMTHAFPHDELNPLTCTGRSRDHDPDNWNVNDVLGNFSLTLIDSLDAHVIMNDTKRFEDAVRLVIRHVDFDLDSRVQVFEVTIRVLGALLSAHTLALHSAIGFRIPWYNGELLALARDLGDRLMPAFATPSGIPWPRVNLRTGVLPNEAVSTCSAGAGTLILEFGVLSRLTGDPKYEAAAKKALFGVWDRRSSIDLVGNTINVLDGKWINELAGIGAGIDSFYEYLFKAYVLFGESEYADAWDVAYQALIKNVRDERGLVYKTVNMVLAGDLQNAAALHQLYFAIWTRYSALPERFDFNTRGPAISSYPLRPELIESTYMLYQATRDPWYLEVGERFINDFEKMARVPCGFASLADVEARTHDDRMESFFLSETLKYLYLLFDDDNFIHALHDNHVFTTEGHLLLLPYNLQNHQSAFAGNETRSQPSNHKANRARVCPRYIPLPGEQRGKPPNNSSDNAPPVSSDTLAMVSRLVVGTGQEARTGLQQVKIEPTNGRPYVPARIIKTSAGLFVDHLAGVTLVLAEDGEAYRVKALNEVALSSADTITVPARGIAFLGTSDGKSPEFEASPLIRLVVDGLDPIQLALATYGPALALGEQISARLVTVPENREKTGVALGCSPHPIGMAADVIEGNLLLLGRGGCQFSEKTAWAELAGAIGVVIVNNEDSLFPMAIGENEAIDSASIPSAMVSEWEGRLLVQMLKKSATGSLNIKLLGPDEISQPDGDGVMAGVTGEVLDTRVQFNGMPISNIQVVFNRTVKQRQRDRAALREDSRDVDYLKDDVADRLVDRLLDIKRRFGKVVDLGSGAGHIAKYVVSQAKSPV